MQTISLLGGLGALPSDLISHLPDANTVQLDPAAPTPRECSADGKYVLDIASDGSTYWRRRSVTDVCTTTSTTPPPNTGDRGPQGGVEVKPGDVMQLGPWTIPVARPGTSYSWIIDDYSKLTPEVAQAISKQLQTPIQDGWKTPIQIGYWNGAPAPLFPVEPGSTATVAYNNGVSITYVWPQQAPWGGPWLTYQGWINMLGLQGKIIDAGYLGGLGDPSLCGGRSEYACSTIGKVLDDAIAPVAKFVNPVTGDDWGLYLSFAGVGPMIDSSKGIRSDGVEVPPRQTQSTVIRFTIKKIPSAPWYSIVLKTLFYVPAKIFNVAIATVQQIVDLACSNADAARTAAASAGPEAVAAVNAALLLCPTKPPETPPPDTTKVNEETGKKAMSPWGLILAAGIATLGITALILTPPKKRPQKQAA